MGRKPCTACDPDFPSPESCPPWTQPSIIITFHTDEALSQFFPRKVMLHIIDMPHIMYISICMTLD